MQQSQNEQEIFREISCLKCFRFPVCYYFREVSQIVTIPELDESSAKKFQPFKPEDLAKICKFYAPDALTA